MKDWFIQFWNKPVVQIVFISTTVIFSAVMLWFVYNILSVLYWLYNLLPPK